MEKVYTMAKKRKKRKKRNPLSIPSLLKKADRIFSQMIRLQAADLYGNCICASCGRVYHWKQIHAGHFAGRNYGPTRYDPDNVHPQCCYCNTFHDGNAAGYAHFIIQKFNTKKITQLWSKAKQDHEWDRDELLRLIEVCIKKVDELQKAKGLY